MLIPLFDPAYDTYEGLKERAPWYFDVVLAVASKIRAGNGPPSATFYKCLDEARGITRSTPFGPVVGKESIQAMLLPAWSTSEWLPASHALRMALDLGLHHVLEKLADAGAKRRSEEEERHLVVSARIWLCLYWFDHQCVCVLHGLSRSCVLTDGASRVSLGTGRPILLKDEISIRHCRILLTHPMTSPSDLRLVTQIELIAQKSE